MRILFWRFGHELLSYWSEGLVTEHTTTITSSMHEMAMRNFFRTTTRLSNIGNSPKDFLVKNAAPKSRSQKSASPLNSTSRYTQSGPPGDRSLASNSLASRQGDPLHSDCFCSSTRCSRSLSSTCSRRSMSDSMFIRERFTFATV